MTSHKLHDLLTNLTKDKISRMRPQTRDSMEDVSVNSIEFEETSVKTPRPDKPILAHQNSASVALESRWLPHGWIGTLIHLCALGFAVMILGVSANNTYFMDVTASRIALYLQLFQFLAKAHDMVVAASLVDIAIYYLTFGVCQASGLPLGFLMAPFQIGSPTSLFQKSYRSALPLRRPKRLSRRDWRTIRFALLIIVATVISAVISPLSAILIVPQLAWWNVDNPFTDGISLKANGVDTGFTYWDIPYDQLWPTSLDSTAIPPPDECWDYNCPMYDAERVYRWGADYHSQFVGSNVALPEQANIIRYLTASLNIETGFAVASTPMSGMSRDVGNMWLWTKRNNLRLGKVGRPVITIASANQERPLLRPLVQTQCGPPVDTSGFDEVELTFPTNQLKYHPEAEALPTSFSYTTGTMEFTQHNQSLEEAPPQFKFIDIRYTTAVGAETPALGVIIAATFIRNDGGTPALPGFKDQTARALFPCTMSFHWVPSVTKLDPLTINVVQVVNNPNPVMFTNASSLPVASIPINVSASYMQALDFNLSSSYTNLTLLGDNLSSLGMRAYWFDGGWAARWPALMATMLSLQSTAALARYRHYANMFIWHIYEANGTLSTSNNLADLNNGAYANKSAPNQQVLGQPQAIRDHPDQYTEIGWLIQRFGYAWSLGAGWATGADVLKHIALAVVLLHLLIVIVHHIAAIINVFRGKAYRCVTWDTPLSLVMLALQTPQQHASRIKGTSTGVEDRQTYRDVVRIEEREIPKNDVQSTVTAKTAVLTINDPLLDDQHPDSEQMLLSEILELPSHIKLKHGSTPSSWSHVSSVPATHARLRPGVKYL